MKKVKDNLTFKALVLFAYDIFTLGLSSVFALLIIGVKDAHEFLDKFKGNIIKRDDSLNRSYHFTR